jgi:hypothetical protein
MLGGIAHGVVDYTIYHYWAAEGRRSAPYDPSSGLCGRHRIRGKSFIRLCIMVKHRDATFQIGTMIRVSTLSMAVLCCITKLNM